MQARIMIILGCAILAFMVCEWIGLSRVSSIVGISVGATFSFLKILYSKESPED